jgi:ankyrin repeat protein
MNDIFSLAGRNKWDEVQLDPNQTDYQLETLLFYAIRGNRADIVKRLVELGTDVNHTNGWRQTPLHILEKDNKEIADILLENGADVNALNGRNETPLHVAVSSGLYNVSKALLEKGADVNVKNMYGETPLHIAVVAGNLPIIKLLVKDYNADVNEKSSKGDSLLHVLITDSKVPDQQKLQILEFLLENSPIDINVENLYGDTPLVMVGLLENPTLALKLLEKGANPNISNEEGDIALSLFIDQNQPNLEEIIRAFLEKGVNPNHTNNAGETLLLKALKVENLGVADILIESGADVNKPDQYKVSPVFILLDLNPRDEAIENTLKLMITKGLKLNIRNQEGKTPVEVAREHGHSPEVLNLLVGETTEPAPTDLWNGFVKSDVDLFHTLFDKPSDISLCPICLEYAERSDGCMYMKHTCGQYRHRELFNLFQVEGLVEWCTLCGRICNGSHKHYELSLPTDTALPKLATVQPTATGEFRFFDKNCKDSGGGGHEEKIKRFNRMLQYACELQNEKGKISKNEAMRELVEECWIAALTRNRAVPSMIEKKKFDFPCVFPEGAEVTTRPDEEQPFPDILRPADEKDLAPVKHEKPDNECVVEIGPHEDGRPVFQFQHKQPDGTIYKHEGEYICAEDLEELIRGGQITGKCPINPEKCKALLYPEELKAIVNDDFYTMYRHNFNRANAVKTGGATEGLFAHVKNEICSIEKKKGGRKTYRKLKKNKNKKNRRKTYRR